MDRRTFLKASALLMLPACSRAASPSVGWPSVGGVFPAFSLADQDGVAVTNADLKGSYAVVEFIRSGDW